MSSAALRTVELLVPVVRDGASLPAGSVISVTADEAVRLLQLRHARLVIAGAERAVGRPSRA